MLDLGDLETAITPRTSEGALSLLSGSLKASQDEYDRVSKQLDETHVVATKAADRLSLEAERCRQQAPGASQNTDLYLGVADLVRRWRIVARAVMVREPEDEDNTVICTECGKHPAELGEGLDGQLCSHCRLAAVQNHMRELARKAGIDLDEDD